LLRWDCWGLLCRNQLIVERGMAKVIFPFAPADCRVLDFVPYSPLFFHTGYYCDCKKEVNDRACMPLLIHTDKSKTKEKEKEERERQQSGEIILESTTAPQFLAGLEDSQDIQVEMTSSRSMTPGGLLCLCTTLCSQLTGKLHGNYPLS